MEGKIFKFFWFPPMPGVVEFSTQHGPHDEFAGTEIFHGDILEYDVDGNPVRAWIKGVTPNEILLEARRQEEARTEERRREVELWRSMNNSRN